jgi:hypothetical protein
MTLLTTALMTWALVVASLVLLAAPADSAAPRWRAGITFDKNQKNPADSRLIWRLYKRTDGTWKVVETRRWRAGSGMLGKAGRNSCVNNKGWLPNGTYRVRQYDDYHGQKIKGRAFRLDDKACSTGNRRFDLFVHTEQGAANKQCKNRRGDQLCRWEFPAFNEYKSAGCIKLAPADLRQLVAVYHRHFAAGVRYAKGRVVLRVKS